MKQYEEMLDATENAMLARNLRKLHYMVNDGLISKEFAAEVAARIPRDDPSPHRFSDPAL